MTARFFALALVVGTHALTALPAAALAQDSLLSYTLKPAVQKGKGSPQVVLVAAADFRKVLLVCDRDGTPITLSAGATASGKTVTFDLPQPDGESHWECEARGHYGAADDEYFDLSMRFDAFVAGAMTITVPRESINLKAQELIARSDRVISAANVKVIGPDGPGFEGDIELPANEPGEDLVIPWQGRDEVLRLDVTLTDKWGFFVFEQIFPWSLEIPHDDVLFATASSEIAAAELPKVEKAWNDVKAVVERYSRFVEVQLFIAGYTDTVGDRDSNQGLSERRAKSIAAAFRARGFKGKVFYQGFGEEGLRIASDDGVDELLNRRAVYILASKPPAPSASMPRSNWRGL